MTIQIMRPVVNLNTGEVYQSVSAAAQRILSIAQGSQNSIISNKLS